MKCHQKTKNVAIQGENLALQWWQCTDDDIVIELALTELPLPISTDSVNACLSPGDELRSRKMTDTLEQQHFAGRRLLQDWFAAECAGLLPFRSDSRMARTAEGAPYMPGLEDCSFSFSTTPHCFAAAFCRNAIIGVDIEQLRHLENPTGLAQRFFAPEEAEAIAALARDRQSAGFLRIWSAKEACLKAVGRGMVYGPEKVLVKSINPDSYEIELPADLGAAASWQVWSPEMADELIVTIALRRR